MARKSVKPELADVFDKIHSQDHKSAYDGLKSILVMQAQGEDCSSLQEDVATINPGRSIKMRRYRNIILGDSYTGIGTILADFQSDNYLLQSFAVKRAGLLATAESADVLVPIIKEAAASEDPHIRESAVFSILKLEKNDTSLIEIYGLNNTLKALLEDNIVSVAANAGSALIEIGQGRAKPLFEPSSKIIFNLITAMQDATEWCRIQILDLVSYFTPSSDEEALGILMRLEAHLYNANSSVTIGVVRSCIHISNFVKDVEKKKMTIQNLLAPLVKLLSGPTEIQYVVLSTILLLFQHFSFVTANVAAFFCKSDEPSYIQIAKLDIVQILTNASNVDSVIGELKQYCDSPIAELAKKSISELGRIALTFESASDTCVQCLTDLIKNSEQNVMEQCICAAVNIFRHYQGKYISLIEAILTRTEGEVEDSSTKSALVWILGQNCETQGAMELLDSVFIENFLEETTDVQLAILTAVIKSFLCNPELGTSMLNRVMPLATLEVNDPDVRDRAYMYMKTLVEVPELADPIITQGESQQIIPAIIVNKKLVDALLPAIGSVANVLKKFPQEFAIQSRDGVILPLLLERNAKTYDIIIRGHFQVTEKNEKQLILKLKNMGSRPLHLTQVVFHYNTFGFTPSDFLLLPKIEAKQSSNIVIPITSKSAFIDRSTPSNMIKIEIKVNQPSTISFRCAIPLGVLLVPESEGRFTKDVFNMEWPKVKPSDEQIFIIHTTPINTLELAKEALQKERVFFFAKKENAGFFSGKTIAGDSFIVIIRFADQNNCKIVLRMENPTMRSLILGLLTQVFQ